MSATMLLRGLAVATLALAAVLAIPGVRLLRAPTLEGEVLALAGRDGTCSAGDRDRKKRLKHRDDRRIDCTLFSATVRYVRDGREGTGAVDAGHARGHVQPVSLAELVVGQRVRLRRDPAARRVYVDTTRGTFQVWGGPALALGFACMFGWMAFRVGGD